MNVPQTWGDSATHNNNSIIIITLVTTLLIQLPVSLSLFIIVTALIILSSKDGQRQTQPRAFRNNLCALGNKFQLLLSLRTATKISGISPEGSGGAFCHSHSKVCIGSCWAPGFEKLVFKQTCPWDRLLFIYKWISRDGKADLPCLPSISWRF